MGNPNHQLLSRRRAHPRATPPSGEAGFALVDALTGLTLLSTTIIFAIGAADVARRASISAAELRIAVPTLDSLSALPLGAPGAQVGRAGDLQWRVTLAHGTTTSGGGTVAICRRMTEVRHLKTRRRQTLATLEPCPRPQP